MKELEEIVCELRTCLNEKFESLEDQSVNITSTLENRKKEVDSFGKRSKEYDKNPFF